MKLNQTQKLEIKKQFSKMNSKSGFLNLLNFTKTLIYKGKTFQFTEKQLNYYINVSDRKVSTTYKSFEVKKKIWQNKNYSCSQ